MPFVSILGLTDSLSDNCEGTDAVHELLHFRSQIRKLALEDSPHLREKTLQECDSIRRHLKNKHNISIKVHKVCVHNAFY